MAPRRSPLLRKNDELHAALDPTYALLPRIPADVLSRVRSYLVHPHHHARDRARWQRAHVAMRISARLQDLRAWCPRFAEQRAARRRDVRRLRVALQLTKHSIAGCYFDASRLDRGCFRHIRAPFARDILYYCSSERRATPSPSTCQSSSHASGFTGSNTSRASASSSGRVDVRQQISR